MLIEKSINDQNESNLKKIFDKDRTKSSKTVNVTIEQLNSYYYSLQENDNSYDPDILKKLRYFAKKQILISPEQFEILVNLAISTADYKIAKKFLGIIKNYLYTEDTDWFLSVAPQDFLEKISIFLPHSRIFEIYRLCIKLDPNNVPIILSEMNIIEPILNNLDNCESLLLYAKLLKNENTSSIYDEYFLNVISGAIQNLKNDDDYDDDYNEYEYYDYYEEYYEKSIIRILKALISSEQCVQMIIQNPNFYTSFLQKISEYLPHNCIFKIYKYCVLADPDNTPMILTEMNIIESILNSLDYDESILLYVELLKNQNTSSIYQEYYPQIISGAIHEFCKNHLDDSIINALGFLISNNECAQLVIQDKKFPELFTHKRYTHYMRIELMKFVNKLCVPNQYIALELASSPIWDFAISSFEKNNSIKVGKKKIEFNHEFFLFLYNIAETNEGKMLLFENDIHLSLFELIKNGEFNNVNDSIKVICQIGLVDNVDVATQLVENGLIDILAESILSLKLNAKRAAIDCISNIQRIGETNNIDDLSDIIFENSELMEAVEALKESDDIFIYHLALALEVRYSHWLE